MSPDDQVLAAVISSALESPHGLLLRTGDFARARARLYGVRRAMMTQAVTSDPDRVQALRALEFRASGVPEGDLLIINHSVSAGTPGP